MSSLVHQLRWLIGIRLVVITSVVLPYFLVQLADRARSPSYDFLYLLGGLTYLATLIYIGLLQLLGQRAVELQAYIQFIGDLLIVTGLVYYFGGVASPFSILYLVVISVAAALLRRRAGIAVATIAWGFYAATILAFHLGWLHPPGPHEHTSVWRMALNLGIHLFGFYAGALLTSYLAQSATRAERELEEKREDLADLQTVHRDVIESITSGLITTDLEGIVVGVNRAGCEILGLLAEDLLGHHIEVSGLVSRAHWDRDTAISREHDAGGGERDPAPPDPSRVQVRDEVEVRRDGTVQHLGFALSRLTDGEGVHTGFIVIFQDLTEHRRLEEELRIKDRMAAVGELAAGIAHEIGNPLAALSGSVQMLSADLQGNSAHRKLLDIILKESHRLDRTVKGFLQFARPKERSTVRFDVARLLAESVELLRNSEELSPRHRVELDLDPPSATLVADPDQVTQIFWNLARNALRAMPEGGVLRVEGKLDGRVYRVRFHDTGRGMSSEARAKLFQPFQGFFDRGTGIGMAIVYRIVHEHGGRLAVDSRPGQGTTITIELPAAVRSARASVGAFEQPVG